MSCKVCCVTKEARRRPIHALGGIQSDVDTAERGWSTPILEKQTRIPQAEDILLRLRKIWNLRWQGAGCLVQLFRHLKSLPTTYEDLMHGLWHWRTYVEMQYPLLPG